MYLSYIYYHINYYHYIIIFIIVIYIIHILDIFKLNKDGIFSSSILGCLSQFQKSSELLKHSFVCFHEFSNTFIMSAIWGSIVLFLKLSFLFQFYDI